MENCIVNVKHLSHKYTTQWAIRDINFEIKGNGVLGLVGSNGAGKSTTMNIICGVLNPTEGDVYIKGINLRKEPEKAKRHIGFLPQKAPLYTELTVDEYLNYCANLHCINGKAAKRAVEEAKSKCEITHFSKRLLCNLSGGYQQRVGIAQAILHHPDFVVLDEPTNGLDPNQILQVRKLIKEIAAERAVLLSTHILSEVKAVCDHVNMIEHGHLVFAGTINDFSNQLTPSTLLISSKRSIPDMELMTIEGVHRIDHLYENTVRLHYSGEDEVAARIIQEGAVKDWQLTEVTPERHSLDAIFAKLSGKEIEE